MTNGKIIKTIGIAVTVIGFGVNILTDWVNEKKMDERIASSFICTYSKLKRKSPC